MFRRRRADLLILVVLFLLPLLLFWPVTLGGKTLLPGLIDASFIIGAGLALWFATGNPLLASLN